MTEQRKSLKKLPHRSLSEDGFDDFLVTQGEKDKETQDTGTDTGTTSSDTHIGFSAFISLGEGIERSTLSDAEIRTLLKHHANQTEQLIEQQRQAREEKQHRVAEEKRTEQRYANGGVGYGYSDRSRQLNSLGGELPPHPILSQAAQFQNVDPQVNQSQRFNAVTNEAERSDVAAELANRLTFTPQPSSPRPRPAGT